MKFIVQIKYEILGEWLCASSSIFLFFFRIAIDTLLTHNWTLLNSIFICLKDICSEIWVKKLQGFKFFQKWANESRYGHVSMFLCMFFGVEHARACSMAIIVKKHRKCRVLFCGGILHFEGAINFITNQKIVSFCSEYYH